VRPRALGRLAPILVFALAAAACGGGGDDEPISEEDATEKLSSLLGDIDWRDDPVAGGASIDRLGSGNLAETLPPITEFPIVVRAPAGSNRVVVEIFASTEKSGTAVKTDGWMVEVAEDFNDAAMQLANGSTAFVEIRQIASGTGYQYIAAGHDLPGAFSPSNQLWVEMAGVHTTVTPVRDRLVSNVAGVVMKSETLDQLETAYPTVDTAAIIDAVIAGDIVMGYTNPFASSTGLNFLLTVLDDIAEADEDRMASPDVASVFERFQQQVPFVALTTLQMRESVENENGTLDAFVMEWQTFKTTDSLRSGFEFIPFGVRHDNPLYAVGDVSADEMEVLELFASFSERSEYRDKAEEYRFDPEPYDSDVAVPSGSTLIDVQGVWKEKKDGGDPVATVFVVDVSGSMAGSRLNAVRDAMLSAREFITPETSVGVVEFSDIATLRLPIAEFDLNQQSKFVQIANSLQSQGGTAMYDGVLLGLDMLLAERDLRPDTRILLVVLTDGETTSGNSFGDVSSTITGLRVPVFTVGFEADLDELRRLSSLVEAASINASEADVEFKIASLFNATG
jgi:Ca-activated chloride channel family protein